MVRVFRNREKPKRLQLVVSPSGSNVDFFATNYTGEAEAGQQHCNYAFGVLDKEPQTLKILPIASNKEDTPARRNGESRRKVFEFRAKMKNLPETAKIEVKLEDLSVKNGIEKVNDGLRKTKMQNHRGCGKIGGNRN